MFFGLFSINLLFYISAICRNFSDKLIKKRQNVFIFIYKMTF